MELLSIIMLSFAVCFIALIVGLVFFNVLVMMGNSEQSKVAEVNPAIIELVDIGKDFGSEKLSGNTREETKENLRKTLDKQRAYLETLPSHKTRVALRKKRKSKQEK